MNTKSAALGLGALIIIGLMPACALAQAYPEKPVRLIGAISTSLPHIRAGKIRGIAVTGLQRSSAVADVPTVAESGFPGFEVVQWFGLMAPAKTPGDVVQRWNSAVVQMHRDAEFAGGLMRRGLEPSTNSPQEFAAFMQRERAMWSKVFKEVGIKL